MKGNSVKSLVIVLSEHQIVCTLACLCISLVCMAGFGAGRVCHVCLAMNTLFARSVTMQRLLS